MKTAFTLLAVFSCACSTSALAAGWETLAGFNDSVTIKDGETAFIVTVSESMIVQYDKPSNRPFGRPVQFQLGAGYDHDHCFQTVNMQRKVIPTTANPFPLSGPATITVKTNGVVSMQVIQTGGAK